MVSAGITNGGTDYDRHHYRAPRPFTWEGFYVRGTNGIGASRKATWYKGGVQVAEAGPLAAATLGLEGTDDVTKVPVARNDILAMSIDRTSTSSSTSLVTRSVLAAPGSRAITPLVAAALTAATLSNAAVRVALGGQLALAASTAEIITHITRFAGTWCGLYAYVISCSGALAQLRAYKNTVPTSMLISVGIGESGMFSDFTNEVEFAKGDRLEIAEDGPSGNSITLSVVGSSLVSEDRKSELYGYGARNMGITAGVPRVIALAGPDPGSGQTLANIDTVSGNTGFPARLSKLRGYCLNTTTEDVTATLYVNGSPTALTYVVPAGTAAYTKFETPDGVHVDVGPLDRWALVFTTEVTFASGFNSAQRAIMVEDLTPEVWRPKVFFHS